MITRERLLEIRNSWNQCVSFTRDCEGRKDGIWLHAYADEPEEPILLNDLIDVALRAMDAAMKEGV